MKLFVTYFWVEYNFVSQETLIYFGNWYFQINMPYAFKLTPILFTSNLNDTVSSLKSCIFMWYDYQYYLERPSSLWLMFWLLINNVNWLRGINLIIWFWFCILYHPHLSVSSSPWLKSVCRDFQVLYWRHKSQSILWLCCMAKCWRW